MIPSSVKVINDNTFTSRCKLESTEIEYESELEELGKYLFTSSSIENITIPKKINEIQEMTFNNENKIKHIKISDNNDRFEYFDDQLLITKSLPGKKYDTLIFSRRDIKGVHIPNTIKYIKKGAFSQCKQLQTVLKSFFK